MAEILNISDYMQEPDLQAMDADALKAYLAQLRERIAELDAREPANMNSEAYEEWGEAHEDLEDLVDEVMDLLDELQE